MYAQFSSECKHHQSNDALLFCFCYKFRPHRPSGESARLHCWSIVNCLSVPISATHTACQVGGEIRLRPVVSCPLQPIPTHRERRFSGYTCKSPYRHYVYPYFVKLFINVLLLLLRGSFMLFVEN